MRLAALAIVRKGGLVEERLVAESRIEPDGLGSPSARGGRGLPDQGPARTVVEPLRVHEPLTVERLFMRHADQVFRIVWSLLGPGASRADAQDLTQQVFLAAHRSLSRFRGESAPLTWLYGIASRVVLMHLRSWGRQRRLRAALEIEPVREVRLEETLIHRDELRRVWRALMRIPPKMRIVYVMYEIEGLSGKEIADALEVPEATVRTRLLHARRALAKALKRDRGGEAP